MNSFKPELLLSLRSYSKDQLIKDLIAGVIVAIIALPLSIALALASGVNPEQGLYTAIVAGFLIAALGGSKVQISGPTAAFATIVAGIVARNGMSGLALATIMAGIILVLMGLFKLGNLIRFIPFTITTGFTSGIAVTILIGQLKDFFGVTYAAGTVAVETMEKAKALAENFSTFNPYALLVGALCLLILIFWPRISRRIPGSLIAIVASVLLVKLCNLPVNTIGDLYSISSSLPAFTLPEFSFSAVGALLPDALTIAVLAAIESLLSCVVADGMIGSKHNSNMELVAQGIGNIGSALFGGIPATGAIARTAANIKNGGRTPVVGIVHAVVLLLILAYNMSEWRQFARIVKTAPKSDVLVLVLTFLLTVVFDLVIAIEVGLILTCVLFMKRMSDTTKLRKWEDNADNSAFKNISPNAAVYELSGPLFFGAADEILKVSAETGKNCIVLRMKGVTAIDSTGLRNLERLFAQCTEAGIVLILSHLNEQPRKTLEKSGLLEKIGSKNICPQIDAALLRAAELAE